MKLSPRRRLVSSRAAHQRLVLAQTQAPTPLAIYIQQAKDFFTDIPSLKNAMPLLIDIKHIAFERPVDLRLLSYRDNSNYTKAINSYIKGHDAAIPSLSAPIFIKPSAETDRHSALIKQIQAASQALLDKPLPVLISNNPHLHADAQAAGLPSVMVVQGYFAQAGQELTALVKTHRSHMLRKSI